MNHTELTELLGAYALDAVDPDERATLEGHLAQCPECRSEVTAHLEVAGLLSSAWAPAPPGVWDRIEAALAEADAVPPPPPAAPPTPPAVVTPLRPERRWGPGYRVAAAVAAVAAGVVAILGVRLADTDRRLDQLAAQLRADDLERVVDAALGDPRAVPVALRSPDGRLAADVVLLPGGRGYLVGSNLPPLPSDRTYQLWAVVDGAAISVGVLGPVATRAAFQAQGAVEALAITDEVAGGVQVSDRTPAVVGQVA